MMWYSMLIQTTTCNNDNHWFLWKSGSLYLPVSNIFYFVHHTKKKKKNKQISLWEDSGLGICGFCVDLSCTDIFSSIYILTQKEPCQRLNCKKALQCSIQEACVAEVFQPSHSRAGVTVHWWDKTCLSWQNPHTSNCMAIHASWNFIRYLSPAFYTVLGYSLVSVVFISSEILLDDLSNNNKTPGSVIIMACCSLFAIWIIFIIILLSFTLKQGKQVKHQAKINHSSCVHV